MKIKILGVILIIALSIAGCGKKVDTKQDSLNVSEVKTVAVKPDITATPSPEPTKTPVAVEVSPTPQPVNVSKDSGTKPLSGKSICIDPGHGNPNHPVKNEQIAPNSDVLKPSTAYGTSGVSTKIPEYKLTMAVSLKIKDKLINKGANVTMTRESNDVDLGNIERAEIGNKIVADISVRIHADGFDNPSVAGISVLYPDNKYINNTELITKSKKAAQFTLDELIKSTSAKSRGIVERNDLTGFNWTKVPTILIEMGFMTNPAEDEKMNTEDYQNKLADGIVNGVVKYFQSMK